MQRTRPHSKRSFGFTIVEVAVIIVVIGILASIITFSIGSWRTRVAETEVKSDLGGVRSAMDAKRNFSNGYPTNPSFNGEGALFQQSPGVEIHYVSGDNKIYCIEAQSKVRWQVSYFITEKDNQPVQGTCASGAGGVPVPTDPGYTVFSFNTTAPGCNSMTIQLPIDSSDGEVNWGDGAVQNVSGIYPSHTYVKDGRYRVAYKGVLPTLGGYPYQNTAGWRCITEVRQWANDATPEWIITIGGANFTYMAEPPQSVTSMQSAFERATSFNQPIGDWDVSHVTNMNRMFQEARSFNQPIGNWDVSNVTNMESMFSTAERFNQPIGNWSTGKVVTMDSMFYEAYAFNQPIGGWNVSNVEDMDAVFSFASSFNQPIGNWDVGKVKSMYGMFREADAFNQAISNWNTEKVTYMGRMFYGSSLFNQDLSSWNVAAVTNHTYFDTGTTAWTLPRPNFP